MKPADRQTAEGILFTDEYQLTMMQLYYRLGLHEMPAQFDHFFRKYPDYGKHQAGYCINAGLEWLLNWMQEVRFRDEDIEYLRRQKTAKGAPIFDEDFLRWLHNHGTFEGITLWAIPEGRVVHPNVPLTVVQGPLATAQLLETSLLNHLNYQTLIATKASRIHQAGREQPLFEFGLRRAQGKSANEGTRAALIGGADFTSNVGVSHVLGYPPKGTHAHSMIQTFMAIGEGEIGAFRAYAEMYPNDCILLVDTVNTLESGVPNAIRVFEELRRKGHEPIGIRLDSGDLAHLSIQAARMLNQAGFPNVRIVLSNQIDELTLLQIISQIQEESSAYGVDADHLIKRLVFGVGTQLITSSGAGALDGVYKLVALQKNEAWIPAIKISDTPAKVPNPGQKRVWRLYDHRHKANVDLISLIDEDLANYENLKLRHPTEPHMYRSILTRDYQMEPLLELIVDNGKYRYECPSIEQIRARRRADLEHLDVGVRRIVNPHIYHVSLTESLWELKHRLIQQATHEI